MVFAGLYALAPNVLDALEIVKPDTVIRWHRAGFRTYWRWGSRSRSGRPRTPAEIRQRIREMSVANRLWGAPRMTSASICVSPVPQGTRTMPPKRRKGTLFLGSQRSAIP
jgi:hypothetical protein